MKTYSIYIKDGDMKNKKKWYDLMSMITPVNREKVYDAESDEPVGTVYTFKGFFGRYVYRKMLIG